MEHTMSTYIYIYYWNTIAFNVYSLYHSLFPECVKGSHSYEIMLHIHKKLSFLLGVAGWPSGAWTVLTCSNVYPVGPRREKTRRLWTKRCLALINPPERLGKIGWGYLGWSNIFYPIVYRAIVLVNIPLFINILGIFDRVDQPNKNKYVLFHQIRLPFNGFCSETNQKSQYQVG